MELPDASRLKEFVAALAPGLIILGIRGQFIPGPTPSLQDRAVSYAAVSVLYYAIVHPVVLATHSIVQVGQFWVSASENVLFPVFVGIGAAFSASKEWGTHFWRFLRLTPIHPIPSAWDQVFYTLKEGRFILVTLNDGSSVAGLYGRQSFASSDPAERDLFVAEVWEPKDTGWVQAAEAKSILICGRDIRTIEIFKGAGYD